MAITILGSSQSKPLGTKKATFSTSSATYVTAQNITGPGVIKSLYWATAGVVMTVNVKVTLDGVLYTTLQSTSNGANYGAQRDGSVLGSIPNSGLDLSFKTSCLIEINTTAGTPTLTTIYDN